MSFDARVVRVMICSPADVFDARNAADKAIQSWNLSNSEHRGLVFLPWRWESSAIPTLGTPAQSVIDQQGVDRSDLVIAFFGSRLGSPTRSAVSGTVEEIERALSQNKPVHLYFSNRPHPADVDHDQLARLREFQASVNEMDLGLYGQFDSLEDLAGSVTLALTAFADGLKHGTASDYFERGLKDRIYQALENGWSYSRHLDRPAMWDAKTYSSRSFTVKGGGEIQKFTFTLTRDGDTQPAFGAYGAVSYELTEANRSSAGIAELLPPRRNSGSSFAQDIAFSPPLRESDRASFTARGYIPGYKFATREAVIAASTNSKLGLRDWDYNSFNVDHPIAQFSFSVFLADGLGAVPLGLQVDRAGNLNHELTEHARSEHYEQERTEQDGEPGWMMRLSVPEPVVGYSYRLKWRPPTQNWIEANPATSVSP